MGKVSRKLNLQYLKLTIYFVYVIILYIFGNNSSTIIYSELILFLFMALELLEMIKKRKVEFCVPIMLIFLFTLFCLLSSLWAINPSKSIVSAKTQLFLSIFVLISYNFFINIQNGDKKLLKIIMYAGLLYSIYVIIYYGVNEYVSMLMNGQRVGEELNNVNTIGLITSISVIIAVFFALYEDKKRYYLITFIPLIVSLGTGSRKVLITLILGVILLFLLRKEKNFKLEDFLKKIVYFIIILGVFIFMSKLPMFSTVFTRFENTINIFTNEGKVDRSTRTRELFIEIGIEQFKKTPFLGIGINNTKYLVYNVKGKYMYLHNNYVELLASVGIIGFLIYYSVYIYIIICCLKYLKFRNPYINIVLVIFLVNLVLEFAMVSYYNKSTYLYIILGIVALNNAKKTIK